jgi:hypothetical protein
VEYGGGFQGRLTAIVDTFEIFIRQKDLFWADAPYLTVMFKTSNTPTAITPSF